MAVKVNLIVAKNNPNLYAAAKSANIPMDQGTQLEQFRTAQKNNIGAASPNIKWDTAKQTFIKTLFPAQNGNPAITQDVGKYYYEKSNVFNMSVFIF